MDRLPKKHEKYHSNDGSDSLKRGWKHHGEKGKNAVSNILSAFHHFLQVYDSMFLRETTLPVHLVV